ncbi:putative mRNA export protein [Gregarina niphandrodes]|uniref:mRNA export protein n=1 Tax=Gregarina niphandrodes TaxID=110365 RepID=A0A023B4X8_GRENI|nr:putative mRNA export protein [Gregarina niphandrodes]EZG57849.1 putative mRNA export protein [Gregarina niphandrodes]|eukprot:XP_011131015.1 putative mRNA export protein [Gregarina niphandrodes]
MYNTSTAPEAIECQCPGSPSDTVSDMDWYWNPNSFPLLAATSWDGSVTVWEVQTNKPLTLNPTPGPTASSDAEDPRPTQMQAIGKLQVNVGSPALCCCFLLGEGIVIGTLDKRLMLMKLPNGELSQLGQHEAAIKRVRLDTGNRCVVSIGLDSAIKWWNYETGQLMHTIKLVSPPVDGDLKSSVLSVMCENHRLYTYNLNDLRSNPTDVHMTSFNYPFITVSLHPDLTSLATGGVEGRVRIVNFQRSNSDFTFRCHRLTDAGQVTSTVSTNVEENNIYCVNSVDFNPLYKTFATAGGDGYVLFWDKDNKARTGLLKQKSSAITQVKFHPSGRLLAVATGYDWSLGITGRTQKNHTYQVSVFSLPDVCIKKKKP